MAKKQKIKGNFWSTAPWKNVFIVSSEAWLLMGVAN